MKKSARAMRLERHHKRMSKDSKLSLVSLMDIFTILVFFLMLNTSDVQVLNNSKSIELPQSSATQVAKETLVLQVNNEVLTLQGFKLVEVPIILTREEESITELSKALSAQSLNIVSDSSNEEGSANTPDITIMGHKTIPYSLLKRIMQTCADAGYTNISLAVEQRLELNKNTSVGNRS